MNDWKGDLRKLKPKLPSSREDIPSKPVLKSEATKKVQDPMEWKKGVRPLRRCPNTVQKKASKPKKDSGKSVRKRIKDQLPSIAEILSAYDRKKPLAKQRVKSKMSAPPALPNFGNLPQVTLTRPSEFKEPDDWVKAGAALQAVGGGTGGRVLQVRMGIDFGTCYTKVSLRAADKVFFVDWDGLRNSNHRYYLPGEVSQRVDRNICLGRPSDALETFSGLKAPFLSSNYAENQNITASVAFIAWVMRYARAWLYRHQELLVKNRRLAWEVNIGSPTDSWCSTPLKDRYRDIGLCAWQFSQNEGNIALEMFSELGKKAGFTPDAVGLDNLQVVPEFAAQVAGYVQSPQRRDGLHMLIDIGAGTMDIVAFNIYRQPKQDANRLPIFSCKVEPLGTHMLMSERLSTLPPEEKNWMDLEGLPTWGKLSSDFGLDDEVLARADKKFSEWVRHSVSAILRYTKTKRYSRAPEWNEGMRVFLTGGGSTCGVYQNGIEQSFGSINTHPLFTAFPALEDVPRYMGQESFHRVSVAFGLSYDAESIGKIILPKDIVDMPLTTKKRELPDRDELYPK